MLRAYFNILAKISYALPCTSAFNGRLFRASLLMIYLLGGYNRNFSSFFFYPMKIRSSGKVIRNVTVGYYNRERRISLWKSSFVLDLILKNKKSSWITNGMPVVDILALKGSIRLSKGFCSCVLLGLHTG